MTKTKWAGGRAQGVQGSEFEPQTTKKKKKKTQKNQKPKTEFQMTSSLFVLTNWLFVKICTNLKIASRDFLGKKHDI
jgi:hypothetical protein